MIPAEWAAQPVNAAADLYMGCGHTWTSLSPDATLQAIFRAGTRVEEVDFVTEATGWLILHRSDDFTELVRTGSR